MYNYRMLSTARKVGVELEVESEAFSQNDVSSHLNGLRRDRQWELDLDEGSLRGGRMGWEIKTRGDGIPIGSLYSALLQVAPILGNSSGTWRAAVHVHVDMSDVEQVAPVFAMSYIMDNAIFDRFAPARRESNFCVPLDHSVTEAQQQLQLFTAGRYAHNNYGKYRSVNVTALDRFNTFEFRHMQMPATSGAMASVHNAIDEIHDFAATCCNVVQFGASYKDVSELLMAASQFQSALFMPEPNVEALYHMLQESTGRQVVNTTSMDIPALNRALPEPSPHRMPQRLTQPRRRNIMPTPNDDFFNSVNTDESDQHYVSDYYVIYTADLADPEEA